MASFACNYMQAGQLVEAKYTEQHDRDPIVYGATPMFGSSRISLSLLRDDTNKFIQVRVTKSKALWAVSCQSKRD